MLKPAFGRAHVVDYLVSRFPSGAFFTRIALGVSHVVNRDLLRQYVEVVVDAELPRVHIRSVLPAPRHQGMRAELRTIHALDDEHGFCRSGLRAGSRMIGNSPRSMALEAPLCRLGLRDE